MEQGAGVVAGLADAGGEIAGGGLESGRSAGFEAEKVESEALQRGGELVDGGAVIAGALCTLFANPDPPAERGAGGNDDGLGAELAVASGGESEFLSWGCGFLVSQRTQGRLRPIPIVVASCFAGDNR